VWALHMHAAGLGGPQHVQGCIYPARESRSRVWVVKQSHDLALHITTRSSDPNKIGSSCTHIHSMTS